MAAPEDFEVEEIPAYEPCGAGDQLYLLVEKVDVSAGELVRQVARRLGVDPRDVGTAGQKDRRAVTRQWVSVPAGAAGPPEALEGAVGSTGSLRVLAASRHGNKLRTGHLRGNRFRIRLRDRDPADDDAFRAALADAAARGFANAFGPQRFSDGATVALGLAALGGERVRDGRRLRFALSAVQAWIFNHWLARRVAAGDVARVLAGDVLERRDSGGRFTSEDPGEDSRRLAAGELVVTGPMPGWKMAMARGEALERERALLAEAGLTADAFAPFRKLARGTRRPALAWPVDASASRDADGLVVAFTLAPGSYATVLLGLLAGPGVFDALPEGDG